jgi:histidyl-tRNA synthetase
VSLRRSSAGNQLKRADQLKARFALVLGDEELKSGRGKLKELATGALHEVDLSALVAAVQGLGAR